MLTRRQFVSGLAAAAAARPLLIARKALAAGETEHLRKMVLLADKEMTASAQAMGSYGVISIRSRDRLDRILKNWLQYGAIKSDSPFVTVDFARESIVGVLDCGDVGNELELGDCHHADGVTDIEAFLGHVVYKQRGKIENRPKLLLIVAPTLAANVTVKTWTPHNGGPRASHEKAQTEWSGVVGPDVGDSVAGLRGHITPAAAKVKAGDDIQLEFKLQYSNDDEKNGAFSRRAEKIYVWDGKYSNGYRNHAFHVAKPDGTKEILRPRVQNAWDKNAPHPVEISANHPYVLPNWAEGKNFKSLKELGLKTEPGKYAITGIYSEAITPPPDRMRRLEPEMWAGELWTNTVIVEVE